LPPYSTVNLTSFPCNR